MRDHDIFEEARAKVDLVAFAEKHTKLFGGKVEKRGVCPVCRSGEKSDSRPFAVYPEDGKWRCFADCQAVQKRSVIDLYIALNPGASPLEAAHALLGGGYQAPDKPLQSRAADNPALRDERRLARAAEAWDTAKPFEGSLAERYLLARGIAPAVVALAAPQLRFHPFAKHSWDEDRRSWLAKPAMLVRVLTPAGPTGGVHATFLLRDGSGRDKALGKKMLGPQSLDGVMGGAWLIGPVGDGDLAVGEGIETVLSIATVAHRAGQPMRAVAALSLDRLQGGVLRDDEGCMDVFDPRPDPARPPFTWPNPPAAPWGRVVVGVDRDMSPAKVWARARRADRHGERKRIEYELDAEARARLCGRLAVAGWRRAGSAAEAIAPPAGSDFNNELQRQLREAAQ